MITLTLVDQPSSSKEPPLLHPMSVGALHSKVSLPHQCMVEKGLLEHWIITRLSGDTYYNYNSHYGTILLQLLELQTYKCRYRIVNGCAHWISQISNYVSLPLLPVANLPSHLRNLILQDLWELLLLCTIPHPQKRKNNRRIPNL